ncbi:uncharacterized protein K441DRAFT_654790 [Cenococcum geophilum 1.58]|uniref:uncharacterized protein n=1 Tax=Cenococcum geophilum 1.58 TaxID=794803 RepID=UPI00358E4D99|nr:hypothetical protein K441DRAFT_654790 [Cenococcum geophilum 1.58]
MSENIMDKFSSQLRRIAITDRLVPIPPTNQSSASVIPPRLPALPVLKCPATPVVRRPALPVA